MTAERAIHFAMFILVLVGLCGISAWASYSYLSDNVVLEVASIALSWGVILSILYIGLKNSTGTGGVKHKTHHIVIVFLSGFSDFQFPA